MTREQKEIVSRELFSKGEVIEYYGLVKQGSDYTIEVTEADGITYLLIPQDSYIRDVCIHGLLELGVRVRELTMKGERNEA